MRRSIVYHCQWCSETSNDRVYMEDHIRIKHKEDTVQEFAIEEVITLG